MATRAHIIVKDSTDTCYVYHHYDGYPEGVGAELETFIKKIYSGNGTARSFCEELEGWDSSYEFENIGPHGDEDYIYTVQLSSIGVILECKDTYRPSSSVAGFPKAFGKEGKSKISAGNGRDNLPGIVTSIVVDVVSEYLQSEEGRKAIEEALKRYLC